jgi:uncharacterized protein
MNDTATETSRSVALRFYTLFDANDIPGVLDLMAEDSTYWLAGKPGTVPTAGNHSKEEMATIFRRMGQRLKDGRLRMQVKQVTAEGERVALEVESRGELLNGRIYNQEYHALFTIRGGKIAAVREYMDTQHVQDVWFRA